MWLFVTLLSCIFLQTNAGSLDYDAENTATAKITGGTSTAVGEFKITALRTTDSATDFKIVATPTGTVKYIGVKYVSSAGGGCGTLSTALTRTDSIWLAMDVEFGLAAVTDIYISRRVAAAGDFFCVQCFDNTGAAMQCEWDISREDAGETGGTNLSTVPSNGWWVTKGITNTNQHIKLAGNLGYLCAAKDGEGSSGISIRESDGTTELLTARSLATSGGSLPYSINHGLFMTNGETSELSFKDVTNDELAACRTFGATMAQLNNAHTTDNVWVTSIGSGAQKGAAGFNILDTADGPVTITMITANIDYVEIAGNRAAVTDVDTIAEIEAADQLQIPSSAALSKLHFFNKILSSNGKTFSGVVCKVAGTAEICAFSLKFSTGWPSTAANTWNINASISGAAGDQAKYDSLKFTTSTTANVYGWLKFVGAGTYKLHFGSGTASTSTYGQLSTRAAQAANAQQNIFIGNYGTTAAENIEAKFELENAAQKATTDVGSWFAYSWENSLTAASVLGNTIETFDIILKQGMETTFKITSPGIANGDAIVFDVDGAHQGETILKMAAASTCTTNDVYFVNTGNKKVCTATPTEHVLTLEKTSASSGSQYFVVTDLEANTNPADNVVDMTTEDTDGILANGGNSYVTTGAGGYGSFKFSAGANNFQKDVQLFVVTAAEQLFLNFGLTVDATAKQGTTDNNGDTIPIDLTESKHIRLGQSTIDAANDDFMGVTCFDGAGAAVTCSILAFHNIVTNAERDTDGAAAGSNNGPFTLPMAGEWFISKLPTGDRKFKRTAGGSATFLGFSTKKSAATAWKLEDGTAQTLINDSIAAASAASPYATAGTPKTEETPFIKVNSANDAYALSITAAADQYVGVLSGTYSTIPSGVSGKIYYHAVGTNNEWVNLETGTALPDLLELTFLAPKPKGFGYKDGEGNAQGAKITSWDSLFDNTNEINKVYIWQSAMTASKYLHTNCYSAVSATPTASVCKYYIRSVTAPANKAYVDGEWFIYKGATGQWGPTLVTAANKKSHFKHGGNFAGTYNLIFTDSAGSTPATAILDTTAAQRLNAAATAGEVRHVTIQHNVLGTDAAGKTFLAGFDTTGAQFYAYSWDNDVTAVDLGAESKLDVIVAKDRRVYSPVVKSSGFATTAEYYIKINELDAANDDIRIYGASTFLGLDATNKYLKFEQNKDHVKIAASTVTTAAAAGETFNILLESPTTKLFRIEKTTTASANLATTVTGTTPPTSAPTAASGPTAAPTAASGPTAAPTAASDSSMYTYSHGFIFILSIITLIGNFIIY